MDFYHVLPSNTSPDYFPNNTATEYSTPLDIPYDLTGNWELGLMNLTYSTCINTFNNDKIIIRENQSEMEKTITIPPCSFEKVDAAIQFINSRINDNRIRLDCTSKRVTLYITDAKLSVTFDNTLRDILAFNKNTYEGPLTYTANGNFSLIRCIQYLYIYSNLASNVRIGNTESPLLAIVPFLVNGSCSLLTEKIFKIPMYISIKQRRVSQIDIAIYDGAGQPVPFVSDAVTTVCLHFRQV